MMKKICNRIAGNCQKKTEAGSNDSRPILSRSSPGSFEKLIAEVLKRSNADSWPEASREWQVVYELYTEIPEECICGGVTDHIFLLENASTKEIIQVEVNCLKYFWGISCDNDGIMRHIEDKNGRWTVIAYRKAEQEVLA